jgi:Protein of unknown function (DUF2911)
MRPLLLALLLGAAPLGAQAVDSGAFVTRLGKDTIAIERFVRTRDSVWGEVVTRAPRTTRARYVARLDRNGNITAYDYVPATGTPVNVTLKNDTVHTAKGATSLTVGGRANRYAVPLAEPTYGLHELLVVRALARPGVRVPFAWWYVGDGPDTGAVFAKQDSAWITTPTDTIRMHVDGRGRILSASDPGGTLQATVTRIAWPDLDAKLAAAPLGNLSPRDTVRGTVGGGQVLIDYGRPSKRGRVVFGNVVGFNTIWRTGANEATTLVTDRDLVLGTAPVPAGTYTLFSYVTPDGWQLVVSKKTGEWGTDYDPTADLVRIPMTVDRNAAPPVERFTIQLWSDRIEMAWDTWKATLPVRASTTTGMR